MRRIHVSITPADLWYLRVGSLLSRLMVYVPDEGTRGTCNDVISATFLDAVWVLRGIEQKEKNEERLASYKKKRAKRDD